MHVYFHLKKEFGRKPKITTKRQIEYIREKKTNKYDLPYKENGRRHLGSQVINL